MEITISPAEIEDPEDGWIDDPDAMSTSDPDERPETPSWTIVMEIDGWDYPTILTSQAGWEEWWNRDICPLAMKLVQPRPGGYLLEIQDCADDSIIGYHFEWLPKEPDEEAA